MKGWTNRMNCLTIRCLIIIHKYAGRLLAQFYNHLSFFSRHFTASNYSDLTSIITILMYIWTVQGFSGWLTDTLLREFRIWSGQPSFAGSGRASPVLQDPDPERLYCTNLFELNETLVTFFENNTVYCISI